jgi:DNA (cytosine-5)-methyltransferase 1
MTLAVQLPYPSSEGALPQLEKALSAVSLFAGAGGLDLGLQAAGWRVSVQIEMDSDAAETLRKQAAKRDHPAWIIHKRIEDVLPDDR